ncbi:hypothetical protein BK661_10130 [Pseudomonas frederiksbergensis]|uniref:Uncharacterized protein n=1 Tax=Pseudomonas frederiksbergensis TaxID=104087 RepID=A0A423J9Q8_9PSED|nr:hypothetical protein [Pseudomonas frederiksbergensis]RON34428.1 hypothetical protein BK661_10130 [Pseudomonas frederiksbergensis]
MPDESAKSLSAPAGTKEGLSTHGTLINWFNGQPRKVDVCYVAAGRTVALGNQVTNGTAVPSVYGEWKDGIVTRTTQEKSASFVAGRWLSSQSLVGETLLSRAMEEFFPMLDGGAQSLRIDDRGVLGLSDVADGATVDAQDWSVAVSGELTVPGLTDQILLRPAVVSLDKNTLKFNEPGVATGAGELTLVLTLDGPEGDMSGLTVSLACAVSLLLDEKIDGAWERPSPLWLPTTTGLLRIGQGELERSPYQFFSESRNIDVRRWFPRLGAGASARLMLDQSGPKTLTVHRNGKDLTLTLKVQRPALVFVLSGLAVDGRGLTAPRRPPGAAAMARAVPLQLVPVHLCGDGASAWSLDFGAEMHLLWTRPGNPDAPDLTHFTGQKNWVLPPEAAVNDAPGISTLRVLIPMLPDGNKQRFRLSAAAGDGGPIFVEPLDSFGKMAPEATGFGPLASFNKDVGKGVDQDKELWPEGAESVVAEPAVLRAAYRVLPPGVAVDGVPASFSSTRVRVSAPSLDADLAPFVVTPQEKASHKGWAYHPASKTPGQRYEHPVDWPGERFGWMDVRFLSPPSVAGEGVPSAALAWGQLQEKEGQYLPTQWVRLGDDSLKRLTKAAKATEEEAIQALADQEISFEPYSLADGATEDRWGLAQMRVVERIDNGKSKITLLAGAEAQQVKIEVAEQPGVSRIVVADAQSRPVMVDIAPAVKTTSLNRIYLELERRGGRLVVARGMLGWGASVAFGWDTKEGEGQDKQFHVTERFERNAGGLQRSVEFNGALSRQVKKAHHVDLYFWDAVHKPGSASLRVICHYRLQQEEHVRSICALQDALLRADESLDLSADIAILKNSSVDQATSLSNPWDPDRRKLYRLQIETRPAHYGFAGFLRIRSATTDSVTAKPVNNNEEARVIPAWFLSDRDLIPWFDTNSATPSPDRDSWTSAGLLRTGAVAGGKGLDLMLYGVEGKWEQSYATTLIGTSDAHTGLPLWVPSPVRVPEENTPAPIDTDGADAMVRLWLFEPSPCMIAQWPVTGGAEAPAKAQQKALQRLWRMGWTREAVLELPSADAAGEVRWEVVDSPLLNRGTSLEWLGWPLAPEAQYPSDLLPATRQVPQTSREGQQSYSVQVEFEHDLPPSQSGANLVRDSGNAQFDMKAPDGLTFRSAGMRVGVQHKIVAYGAEASPALSTAQLAWPEQQNGTSLSLDGGWLAWKSESVDLAEEKLMRLPDGVLLYTFPNPCNELRITGAAPGLQWQAPDGDWVPVGDNEWLKLAPVGAASNAISLKLPEPARWSGLSVTLRTRTAGIPALGEIKTLFPSGGTRMAGIFDKDDKLLAFGEEQTFYLAPQSPPDGPSIWTRVTGIALSPGQVAAVKRVITINLDGQTVESEMPDPL